jgi:hypothetical protein
MSARGIPCVFFALNCQNEPQGMMAVTPGLACRIPQGSDTLAYVEYIATAPWNLADLLGAVGERARYRAVGPALLSVAIGYSRWVGFGGRIGLHALPQAEPFYRDACGMTDLGYDSAHDLRYFEFTEDQALRFLGEEA